MAKSIDSPASRDAARQAQKTSQAGQARTGKQAMGIGVQPSQSQFGQILQEQLGQGTQLSRQETEKPREDKPEDRRSESRDSGKGKDSVNRDAAAQDRVRESKGRDDSRDRSGDQSESKGGEHKESTTQAKEAEQRVVAKQQGRGDSGSHKGGQEGKSQDGRQGSGQQSRGDASATPGKTAQQSTRQQAKPQFAQGAMATAQTGAASKAAAKAAPMAKIPQQVIDQIVSYARLHHKKDGETEMELALHEEVFKGLRMRISTKDGKIQTTFITSSRDVRDLFNTHKQTLRRQMTENGLEVEGIDVIMT